MLTEQEDRDWAGQEFGLAALGDRRRVERLVRMAAVLANQPAGKVTAAFERAAEREGAFRFLENDLVSSEEIRLASHRACARRAVGGAFAFVPVDGSSLKLTDREKKKGLGVVGPRSNGAAGVHVMSALAISSDGVPLGLCGQTYWTRKRRSTVGEGHDRRPVEKKETRHWLDVKQQVRKVFAAEAPQTRPWFQLDRGGDAWPVLLDGLKTSELFTIRAAHDRRVTMASADNKRRYLWETLESEPVLATLALQVRARPVRRRNRGKPHPARPARVATLELKARQISLEFCVDHSKKWVTSAPLYALLACETVESANGAEPIEWLLLTNHPITNGTDAQLVLFGYSQRWRIEEFHKCWKSGACKVEETQLRDLDHILRWASVLAAVAVRVLRLTYLARHEPGLSALVELSRHEVDAIVLASKSGLKSGTDLPIKVVVELLAGIGGYTGRSSGGPPGPLVLARGLLKIEACAALLESGIMVPAPGM